jgi:hypothetical protein
MTQPTALLAHCFHSWQWRNCTQALSLSRFLLVMWYDEYSLSQNICKWLSSVSSSAAQLAPNSSLWPVQCQAVVLGKIVKKWFLTPDCWLNISDVPSDTNDVKFSFRIWWKIHFFKQFITDANYFHYEFIVHYHCISYIPNQTERIEIPLMHLL